MRLMMPSTSTHIAMSSFTLTTLIIALILVSIPIVSSVHATNDNDIVATTTTIATTTTFGPDAAMSGSSIVAADLGRPSVMTTTTMTSTAAFTTNKHKSMTRQWYEHSDLIRHAITHEQDLRSYDIQQQQQQQQHGQQGSRPKLQNHENHQRRYLRLGGQPSSSSTSSTTTSNILSSTAAGGDDGFYMEAQLGENNQLLPPTIWLLLGISWIMTIAFVYLFMKEWYDRRYLLNDHNDDPTVKLDDDDDDDNDSLNDGSSTTGETDEIDASIQDHISIDSGSNDENGD